MKQMPKLTPYQKELKGSDYIKIAGGITKSSMKKMYVIKQSTSQRIKLTNSVNIETGDIIFIPEKIEYDKLERMSSITSIIYQLLISVMTVYTLMQP